MTVCALAATVTMMIVIFLHGTLAYDGASQCITMPSLVTKLGKGWLSWQHFELEMQVQY